MERRLKTELAIGFILVCLAIGTRFLDLPFNFSPILAISLYCGYLLSQSRLKWFVPVVFMYLSDLILNNTEYRSFYENQEGLIFFADYMIWTYGAILLVVFMGSRWLRKLRINNVFAASIAGAIIFFVISNFGAWTSSHNGYSPGLDGLIQSYLAGIPFFRATLISNVVFSLILFGAHQSILTLYHLKFQRVL